MLKSPLSLERKFTVEGKRSLGGSITVIHKDEFYGFTLKEYLEYFKEVILKVEEITNGYFTRNGNNISRSTLRNILHIIHNKLEFKYLAEYEVCHNLDVYFKPLFSGNIIDSQIKIIEPEVFAYMNFSTAKGRKEFLDGLRVVVLSTGSIRDSKDFNMNYTTRVIPNEQLDKYFFINTSKRGLNFPLLYQDLNVTKFLSTLPQYSSFLDFIEKNIFYNDKMEFLLGANRKGLNEEEKSIYAKYLEEHFENHISGSLINGKKFDLLAKSPGEVIPKKQAVKPPRRKKPPVVETEGNANPANSVNLNDAWSGVEWIPTQEASALVSTFTPE